jgi:putative mRNA 3-end processing factor
VTWRDGVHLTGTPIWCDARRRRDICYVSSAERVGRAGHGQLIGTPITLALLAGRGDGHLAVPVRQRFTLGTLRLELIPSGRGLGGAALHVDHAGRGVLYAGAIRTMAGGAGDAAEVRTAEAVVVAAPFGEKHHRFPPLAEVIAQTLAWTRAQLAADRRPVLYVDTALDGLEVALRLGTEGIAVAAGRPIRDAALRIGALTRLPAIGTPGKDPRAIVWLDADRLGLARALGDRPRATARVSGRVLDNAIGTDAAFAWSNAADRVQLLSWIESTGARDVFVTGACADAIAAALGARARVIGPPQQMALFAP